MVNKVRGSVIDFPTISATIPTATTYPDGTVVFNSAGNTPIGWRYTSGTWKPFGSTYLESSTTWDPPAVVANSYTLTTVSVAGATVGDQVFVSFSQDITGCMLQGSVNTNGVVTVTLQNLTGSTVNLSSGSLRVRVERS